MAELSKREALRILTRVVDNEATPQETKDFQNFIETDPEVKYQYESMLIVKKLIRDRYNKQKAPGSLRNFVINQAYVRGAPLEDYSVSQGPSGSGKSEKIHSFIDKKQVKRNTSIFFRCISAVAAILLFSILIVEFLDRSTFTEPAVMYQVEDCAYTHFEKHNGEYILPTFQTTSIQDAESYLDEFHSLNIRIPSVRGATFSGIVFSEFIPEFDTPLFEYYQKEANQYIYIFAFHIPKLKSVTNLSRDSIAIEKSITENNFHIKEINGKHVVSWKWDDNWYTAVSNYNGDELASIIEPLNYTTE